MTEVRVDAVAAPRLEAGMPTPPAFEHFDAAMAESMMQTRAGGLPDWLGVRFTEFTAGRLRAFGTLHGGVVAGLVDHVLGCVLYPLMPRGQWAATTEFKLNYLAPVKGGTLTAESTVIAFGRRTAVVSVEVRNGEQLACVAQGTLLVSDPSRKSA